ncbi:hypothetical protein D9758_018217 [Tetrapyrgos nigripes]|uniref:Uncharacterized protein n=1 Tax=Tetrapyrgos nigripes TaxID=182062 RepID=A0A8H5BC70_9AGAR|nr:hypothetical protein D9758_018217 [Tetrapyrgos nigripes]
MTTTFTSSRLGSAAATQPISLAPNPTSLALTPQETAFAFDLGNNLVSVSSYVKPLDLPTPCAAYTIPGDNLECPPIPGSNSPNGSMTAYSVFFDDCGAAFIVCRCDNANMSLDTIRDRLSRVPVGLRQYLASVVVLPGDEARAYTLRSGDVHIFGDAGVNIWVHESMHAYDFTILVPHHPLSDYSVWKRAIQADSCVPDDYSATNAVEDFAQMGVIKMYTLANNGALPEGMQAECMSNQLKFMDGVPLFNTTTLFGNTCFADYGDNFGSKHSVPPPVLNLTSRLPIPDTDGGDVGKVGMTSGIAASASTPAPPSPSSGGVSTSRPHSLAVLVTLLALTNVLGALCAFW